MIKGKTMKTKKSSRKTHKNVRRMTQKGGGARPVKRSVNATVNQIEFANELLRIEKEQSEKQEKERLIKKLFNPDNHNKNSVTKL